MSRTGRDGGELRWQHDQKDEAENGDGVDAVGQCTAIITAFLACETHGLPGVIDVADEDAERCAGQDVLVEKLCIEAKDEATQRIDQEELNEIVQGEPEEPVDIGTNEPAHEFSRAWEVRCACGSTRKG